MSKGIAEFLAEGERLQPKVRLSAPGGPLCKALTMLWFSEGEATAH